MLLAKGEMSKSGLAGGFSGHIEMINGLFMISVLGVPLLLGSVLIPKSELLAFLSLQFL
jgi:hypothetical protein